MNPDPTTTNSGCSARRTQATQEEAMNAHLSFPGLSFYRSQHDNQSRAPREFGNMTI